METIRKLIRRSAPPSETFHEVADLHGRLSYLHRHECGEIIEKAGMVYKLIQEPSTSKEDKMELEAIVVEGKKEYLAVMKKSLDFEKSSKLLQQEAIFNAKLSQYFKDWKTTPLSHETQINYIGDKIWKLTTKNQKTTSKMMKKYDKDIEKTMEKEVKNLDELIRNEASSSTLGIKPIDIY